MDVFVDVQTLCSRLLPLPVPKEQKTLEPCVETCTGRIELLPRFPAFLEKARGGTGGGGGGKGGEEGHFVLPWRGSRAYQRAVTPEGAVRTPSAFLSSELLFVVLCIFFTVVAVGGGRGGEGRRTVSACACLAMIDFFFFLSFGRRSINRSVCY